MVGIPVNLGLSFVPKPMNMQSPAQYRGDGRIALSNMYIIMSNPRHISSHSKAHLQAWLHLDFQKRKARNRP